MAIARDDEVGGIARIPVECDAWHTKATWTRPGGEAVDVDYVCVDPEHAEVATRVLGGTWQQLPLGPRILLIRIALALQLLPNPPA